MKNSKFWIWFIPLLLIVCAGIYFLLSNANKKEDNKPIVSINEDGKKIKNDYEKLNNDSYLNIKINENNVFYYLSYDEMKNNYNKENMIIFLGEVSVNNSREAIKVLDDVTGSYSISKIYYIEISRLDDDYKNYLLNKLNVNTLEAATLVTTKEGSVVDIYTYKEEDKNILAKKYQELISSYIDVCNDAC